MGRGPIRLNGDQVLIELFERYGIPYTEEDIRGSNSLAHKYNRGDNIEGMFQQRYRQQIKDHSGQDYWDTIHAQNISYQIPGNRNNSARTGYGRDLSDLHTFQGQLPFDMGSQEGSEDYEEFESRFIDEMYGTATFDHEGNITSTSEGLIEQGLDKDIMGLDIKRLGTDDMDIDNPALYETLTRGEIDWDYYQDGQPADNMWVKAHAELGGDDKIDTIEEIRNANKLVYEQILQGRTGENPNDWDGKYQPSYQYEEGAKYEAAYVDVGDYTPSPLDPVKEQRTFISGEQPDITGVDWGYDGRTPSLKSDFKHIARRPMNLPIGEVSKLGGLT
tara:strand:- start:998 stop:1993 length:996 start_codon:yes stop_codon:yes gene_type:complete